MSRARKTRRALKWARYFNHYASIPWIRVGGGRCAQRMHEVTATQWGIVRNQEKWTFPR